MATVVRAGQPLETRASPLPDFTWRTGPRMGPLAGLRWLHADLRSLDPDRFSFPYHAHRASEELFFVVEGSATLRTPKGFEELRAGDTALFESGPAGAHQLYNHTDRPCVYLDVRCTPSPGGLDVVDYPDSGKVVVLPIGDDVYRRASHVAYHDGEQGVRAHWPAGLLRPR